MRGNYNWYHAAAALGLSFLSAVPVSCISKKIAEALFVPPERTLEQRADEPVPAKPAAEEPQESTKKRIPIPNAKSFADVSDDVLLGMLVFGEVRNAPAYIQEMVAHTAYNRAGGHKWWGHTLREVMLKPQQYKCFEDVNKPKMLNPTAHEPLAVWERCYGSAQRAGAQETSGTDLSKDATHFYITQVVKGKETFPEPWWAKGKSAIASENWKDSKGKNIRIKFYYLNN
jgi:N-acetylmuramoyl-L-alanine amidase